MKKKMLFGLIAIIVILFQTGCGMIGGAPQTQEPPPPVDSGDQVAAAIAQTQAALNAQVVPTNTTAPPIVLPTNTVEVPTAAPVQAVQGTVNYGANCRSGPGGNFLNLVILQQGTSVDIIGTSKSTNGETWWQVSSSGNEDCWLVDEALAISGDTSSVAQVVSPPTPTPEPPPSWAYTWTYWMGGGFGGAVDASGTMTLNQTGNTVTGSLTQWGFTFTINGTASADGKVINGTLRRSNDGVIWQIILKRLPGNNNQFNGSWWLTGATEWDGAWCGAKDGAGQPSPCKTH